MNVIKKKNIFTEKFIIFLSVSFFYRQICRKSAEKLDGRRRIAVNRWPGQTRRLNSTRKGKINKSQSGAERGTARQQCTAYGHKNIVLCRNTAILGVRDLCDVGAYLLCIACQSCFCNRLTTLPIITLLSLLQLELEWRSSHTFVSKAERHEL